MLGHTCLPHLCRARLSIPLRNAPISKPDLPLLIHSRKPLRVSCHLAFCCSSSLVCNPPSQHATAHTALDRPVYHGEGGRLAWLPYCDGLAALSRG